MATTAEPTNLGPITAAGLVLGIGLGGFVDGILLHQIMQWHNMLSSRIPPTTLVTIDHQILGLHHVHPGAGQLAWDLGFLASGIVLMAAGALLARTGRAAYPGLHEPIPAS